MRSEIVKLWEMLEGTDTNRAIYQKIANIYFGNDEGASERIRSIVGK
jgi:hypothetical protein